MHLFEITSAMLTATTVREWRHINMERDNGDGEKCGGDGHRNSGSV